MSIPVTDIAFESSQVNGIGLHVLTTDKFKTTTMVVFIEQALSSENVTKTALLAHVLKRATARLPDSKQLREHLDFLYGAIFDVDVAKKGERQILQLYLEVPNEQYLSNETTLLEQAVQFLGDVLTRPYLEDGVFAEKYIQAEKESLRKRIESIIDDKMKYANQRITEEMFKGEPFSLLVHGQRADLPTITADRLYAYYRELLSHNPIHLFVVGDVDRGQIEQYLARHLQIERGEPAQLGPLAVQKTVSEVREVVDRLDVTQGKLNIGCRTQITYRDDDYPALVMTNGVLGGFPHSKLFINVREKASLAYYAVSRLESHKGVLMMMSGIDVANYEKAVSIMKEQLQMVRDGKISDMEMNQTRATVTNQYRELMDSARLMIDFTYNGLLSGRRRGLTELLEEIGQIGIEEIRRVADKVQIDTIYLLRDRKGGA
ncbi:insulinase family protein [Brevibacillus humidisoli]|uniref:EF-P 5-aminopentanol modification-associated protein YfmF n=1 Tax=Brevibacillus humidisoli TaxID=2895522 RepID=UPI001E4A538F|nr:pitrilysin family protein [Brevibacillus humidisoli]UFJ42202.1 insulinase family protein [Brevibacillus humidisoli]